MSELIVRVGCSRCEDHGCNYCQPEVAGRRKFFLLGALFAAAAPQILKPQPLMAHISEIAEWKPISPTRRRVHGMTMDVGAPASGESVIQFYADNLLIAEQVIPAGSRYVHFAPDNPIHCNEFKFSLASSGDPFRVLRSKIVTSAADPNTKVQVRFSR